jgi:hypothetical protein
MASAEHAMLSRFKSIVDKWCKDEGLRAEVDPKYISGGATLCITSGWDYHLNVEVSRRDLNYPDEFLHTLLVGVIEQATDGFIKGMDTYHQALIEVLGSPETWMDLVNIPKHSLKDRCRRLAALSILSGENHVYVTGEENQSISLTRTFRPSSMLG